MQVQVLGFDDADRMFLAIPAAVLATVSALGLGVALGYVLERSTDPDSRPSASVSQPDAGSGCAEAVARAAEALAVAREVDVALAAHTDVLSDLRAQRVTREQALQRSAPVLTEGADRSVQLDVLTQRFEQVAGGCRP